MIRKISTGIALGNVSRRSAVGDRARGLGQRIEGAFGEDGHRLRPRRIRRLRSQGQGALHQRLRSRPQAGRQGRQGQDHQGLARRQNSRGWIPSRQGPGPQQAEGHLDQGQPAVGHRHRRGLGVRSQDQGRQEARPARHHVRQRSDRDGQHALCQRQPLRPVVPRRAGGFPESRKQPPKITVVFKGKGVFPNGLYPGKDGALLHGRLRVQGKAARHLSDGAGQGRRRCYPTISACSTASIA